MSFWDTLFRSTQTSQDWANYGQFAAGVLGTILAGLSLFFFFWTWVVTHRRNTEDSASALIGNFCDNHDRIIDGMAYGTKKGAEIFPVFLGEFYNAFRRTAASVKSRNMALSEMQQIDIAYHFTYYGVSKLNLSRLAHYDQDLIKEIHDALAQRRPVEKISGAPDRIVSRDGRDFRGHQNNLGHYFRNLYAAYNEIDRLHLNLSRRATLAKRIRARLSNYEQAVLCLNSISTLGCAWRHSNLLTRYQVIKNIPDGFFQFGNNLNQCLQKRFYPSIIFEWEEGVILAPQDITEDFQILGFCFSYHDTWKSAPKRERKIIFEFRDKEGRSVIKSSALFDDKTRII